MLIISSRYAPTRELTTILAEAKITDRRRHYGRDAAGGYHRTEARPEQTFFIVFFRFILWLWKSFALTPLDAAKKVKKAVLTPLCLLTIRQPYQAKSLAPGH
jgi:hypothetical protein